MKILIVTEYFYPEEFKINELADYWSSKGYEVGVLTRIPTYPFGKVYQNYKNKFYSKEVFNGITIYRIFATEGYQKRLIKKLMQFVNYAIFGSILGLFIGRKYEYIFSFNQSSLTAVLPAIFIKKLFNKRLITWTQDIWPDSVYAYGLKENKYNKFLLDRFVGFVYNNVDHITVSCEGFIEKLSPYVKNEKKFTFVPQWADNLESKSEQFDLSSNEKIHFSFAGNISKAVNLDTIVLAYREFQDQNPNFQSQLNIIGDGSNLQKIKELVDDKSIKNIIFWGRQPKTEMGKFYEKSNFLIISLNDHPLYSMMIPAKFQTYLAANKPILAIMNGVVSDIVKKNNIGISCKPDDISMIAQSFKHCCLMNTDVVRQVKENSLRLLNSDFNKDTIQNNLTNILLNK